MSGLADRIELRMNDVEVQRAAKAEILQVYELESVAPHDLEGVVRRMVASRRIHEATAARLGFPTTLADYRAP